MSTEVSYYQRQSQPYSMIGLIIATFSDGSFSQGSCSLVGVNDILTATHVIYDPDKGGWAVGFDFYFGADYNNLYGYFEDYGYSYSPNNWSIDAFPEQVFVDSENNTMLQSEAQYDIAIIGVNTPIGDALGWLDIGPGYNVSTTANAVGYPARGTGMMQESVYVQNSPYYGIYTSRYDVLGSGSSGGPLLVGNNVIGVKSTGIWWADIDFVYDELVRVLNENNSLIPFLDTTAPVVNFYNPADNAIGVDPSSDIVLVFSEKIQRGTGNIFLKDTSSGTVVETFHIATSSRVNIVDDTLTINPTNDLEYNTNYQVIISYGNIKDLAGNNFAGTWRYDFTTEVQPFPGVGTNFADIITGNDSDNTIFGLEGDDLLLGAAGNDYLSGGPGNDTLKGGIGNDIIYGGPGIDTVVYDDRLAEYTVRKFISSFIVSGSDDGTDTLSFDVERLTFNDTSLAFDLDGNAGTVAKILGVVFGSESVANKSAVGIGLSLLDDGMSPDELATLAITVAGVTTNAGVIDTLWENLFGTYPTDEEMAPFVSMLDNGIYTVGQITIVAAESDLNEYNIDLIGIAQTGLEYYPAA